MQVGSYRDSPTTPGSGEYLARESFDRALGAWEGPPRAFPVHLHIFGGGATPAATYFGCDICRLL